MQHESRLFLKLKASTEGCHFRLTILVEPELRPSDGHQDRLWTDAVVCYEFVVREDELGSL